MEQSEVTVILNIRYFSWTWNELQIWQSCWSGEVREDISKAMRFGLHKNAVEIHNYVELRACGRRRVICKTWIGKIPFAVTRCLAVSLKQGMQYSNSNSVYEAEFMMSFCLIFRIIKKALISKEFLRGAWYILLWGQKQRMKMTWLEHPPKLV